MTIPETLDHRVRVNRGQTSISVIVPLAESKLPDSWAASLMLQCRHAELVLAAASMVPDHIVASLRRRGARVLRSDAPRGSRLKEAASSTPAETLVFLHGDTRLPDSWDRLILAALREDRPWGAFRLSFGRNGAELPWIAWGANMRSRLLGLPFGDQVPFVTRSVYEVVGGHPPWSFLDDLELSLRLRRLARPLLLPARVVTSPRRYHAHGRARSVLANLRILLGFALGRSPEDLKRWYERGVDG